MMLHWTITVAMVAVLVSHAPCAYGVIIETVPVDNPGNAGELSGEGAGGFGPDAIVGGISYNYRIGEYEVTNAQYVEFLNGVDPTGANTLSLYDDEMSSNKAGGITLNPAAAADSKYEPKVHFDNKPVNHVTWYDAIRFANWFQNGQGNGDTETGAYTLLGGTSTPSNGPSITRNPGATWFLPSEDEWYKAAYYDPRSEAQGGPAGDDNYWLYPTSSDTIPTVAMASAAGDISNPGTNVANYGHGADWNSLNGNVTTVGTAGEGSMSFYGTFDQGGNVSEWNEDRIPAFGSSYRSLRGSSMFTDSPDPMTASFRNAVYPELEITTIGFRIAGISEGRLPGDANGDLAVNLLDFQILSDNFGITGSGTFDMGDFNGDRNIDLLDFDILQENYGIELPMPISAVLNAQVPEPSTIFLAALGLLVSTTCGGRRHHVTSAHACAAEDDLFQNVEQRHAGSSPH